MMYEAGVVSENNTELRKAVKSARGVTVSVNVSSDDWYHCQITKTVALAMCDGVGFIEWMESDGFVIIGK